MKKNLVKISGVFCVLASSLIIIAVVSELLSGVPFLLIRHTGDYFGYIDYMFECGDVFFNKITYFGLLPMGFGLLIPASIGLAEFILPEGGRMKYLIPSVVSIGVFILLVAAEGCINFTTASISVVTERTPEAAYPAIAAVHSGMLQVWVVFSGYFCPLIFVVGFGVLANYSRKCEIPRIFSLLGLASSFSALSWLLYLFPDPLFLLAQPLSE
ncbi:MAG: hypothetical protein ACFE7R_11275, partial [Candidatus Hodarchaeota archaeon]